MILPAYNARVHVDVSVTYPEDDVSVATGAGPLTAAAVALTELIEG